MIKLLVFPSCSLKLMLIEKTKEFVTRYNKNHEEKIYCPMIEDMITRKYADQLSEGNYADDYPDIIIQAGYKNLFTPECEERLEVEGYMNPLEEIYKDKNKTYKNIELEDPNRKKGILAGSCSVIVVNKELIGDIKKPTSMKDLLSKQYKGMLTIQGHNNNTCDMITIMDVYKKYGREGVMQLENSIKEFKHFSWVVKNISNSKSGISPIAIVPEVFAPFLSKHKNLEIIWPTDGSPLFPLFITVRKDKYDDVKEVIDFFAGEEVGKTLSDSYFLSINNKVDNGDYVNKTISWLGWDIINKSDTYSLIKSLERELVEKVNKKNGIELNISQCKNIC